MIARLVGMTALAAALAGCVSTQGGPQAPIGPQECNPLNQPTAYNVQTVWPMEVGQAGCNGALSLGGTLISSSISQQPQNGTATINMDECTYTPKPGFTGKDSFVMKVTAAGGSASGTSIIKFDITVK